MKQIYSLYIDAEDMNFLTEFAFKNKIKSKNEILRQAIKKYIAAIKENEDSKIKWQDI